MPDLGVALLALDRRRRVATAGLGQWLAPALLASTTLTQAFLAVQRTRAAVDTGGG